jgi:hypothetical protein
MSDSSGDESLGDDIQKRYHFGPHLLRRIKLPNKRYDLWREEHKEKVLKIKIVNELEWIDYYMILGIINHNFFELYRTYMVFVRYPLRKYRLELKYQINAITHSGNCSNASDIEDEETVYIVNDKKIPKEFNMEDINSYGHFNKPFPEYINKFKLETGCISDTCGCCGTGFSKHIINAKIYLKNNIKRNIKEISRTKNPSF